MFYNRWRRHSYLGYMSPAEFEAAVTAALAAYPGCPSFRRKVTWNLPRLIGPTCAADLLYTGRLIGAAEALELGLVNRVGGEDFDAKVDELAAQVSGNGPISVRALKETFRGTMERTIEEALGAEANAQVMTFETADAKEGIAAVIAKRAPVFTGK